MDTTHADFLAGLAATVQEILGWFHPAFFAYNLVLFLVAVSVPPVITWIYVHLMKGEKKRRLHKEFPQALWEKERAEITTLVDDFFKQRRYLGSTVLLTTVIALGASIILFLKPVLRAGEAAGETGLDFSTGANILMLGPYAVYTAKEYFPRLVMGLTAFQYGFLGAYVHFVSELSRSYFTLDLTPHTYVEATIRMITGSLAALVLSFALFDAADFSTPQAGGTTVLPLLSFFIGFFPARGLLAIEKLATLSIRVLPKVDYRSAELSSLPGMSYSHELRLRREGFDNVENLSHANACDLAVRTGFSYCQLEHWKGQAWLYAHLRGDYDEFVRMTGITSRRELMVCLDAWSRERTDPTAEGVSHELRDKVRVVSTLARHET